MQVISTNKVFSTIRISTLFFFLSAQVGLCKETWNFSMQVW
jgi:hypothetical protein